MECWQCKKPILSRESLYVENTKRVFDEKDALYDFIVINHMGETYPDQKVTIHMGCALIVLKNSIEAKGRHEQ